jgi:hypothetical protein
MSEDIYFRLLLKSYESDYSLYINFFSEYMAKVTRQSDSPHILVYIYVCINICMCVCVYTCAIPCVVRVDMVLVIADLRRLLPT